MLQKEDNDWEYEVEGSTDSLFAQPLSKSSLVYLLVWIPDQEVDQGRLGERLCKETVRHINWTRTILLIILDGGR